MKQVVAFFFGLILALALSLFAEVSRADTFISTGVRDSGKVLLCKLKGNSITVGRGKGVSGQGFRTIAAEIKSISKSKKLSKKRKASAIRGLRVLESNGRFLCESELRNSPLFGTWRVSYSCEDFLTDSCVETLTLTFKPGGIYEASIQGASACYDGLTGPRRIVPHKLNTTGSYTLGSDGHLTVLQTGGSYNYKDCPLFGSNAVDKTGDMGSSAPIRIASSIPDRNTLALTSSCPLTGRGLYFCWVERGPLVRVTE
jgi:hypothetical protein